MIDYQILDVEQLLPFDIRDIRPQVIERLKERIGQGYNPAKPLTAVKTEDGFLVVDGNHVPAEIKEKYVTVTRYWKRNIEKITAE